MSDHAHNIYYLLSILYLSTVPFAFSTQGCVQICFQYHASDIISFAIFKDTMFSCAICFEICNHHIIGNIAIFVCFLLETASDDAEGTATQLRIFGFDLRDA